MRGQRWRQGFGHRRGLVEGWHVIRICDYEETFCCGFASENINKLFILIHE